MLISYFVELPPLSASKNKYTNIEYLCIFLDSLKPGGAAVKSNEPENEWKEQKKKFHTHVAKFFLKQSLCQRTIEELPWQLLMSGDIKTLVQVLTDPK